MNRNERIRLFVEEMWTWYGVHKRVLPWRDLPDTDPTERAYKVFVSEIMLQQTQVPRVIATYKNFLERFPTISDLAEASNRDVLMAWRGMGYNSRALRLRDAAKRIMENAFPTSMEDLVNIPGIGHYTAAAIRNFAFGIPTPCIDTNIRRILHRTFVGPENADGSWEKEDEYLLQIASEVLEEALGQKSKRGKRRKRGSSFTSFSSFPSFSSEWHAALMDFGSLVQTKRNPKWEICPLTEKGIMKTTKKNYELRIKNNGKSRNPKPATRNQEPGRLVGSVFIPNRIFRGRVVDALRDHASGLTLDQIGRQISIDWDRMLHRAWLSSIMKKLLSDRLIREEKGKYVLG